MNDDPRHPPLAQPTSEDTADESTQTASGLTADRPGENREDREHRPEDREDVVARTDRGEDTPRRYDEGTEDDVLPSDDASLNTKI